VLAVDGARATLAIRRDNQSEFAQWFHFRVSGVAGRELDLAITGRTLRPIPMAGPAIPPAFPKIARNGPAPHRISIVGAMAARCTSAIGPRATRCGSPISPLFAERHNDLVSEAAASPGVAHHVLGLTLDGRSIDCLTLGTGARQVWLYARQHPGETMAEWWMEGALELLTDPADPHGRALRQACVPHRAQLQSRWQRARAPAHQRGGRQPQPRMARTEHGAFARSAGDPQCDG
jgi:hypothetical protein